MLVMSPAALPETSLAYDIKPKTPESAFAAKLHPDILGISADSTAETARAIFVSAFKGHIDTKTDIQQLKFGGTATSYIAALIFSLPSGPKQTGEVLSSSFSSPASANRAYFVARNLTFAQDQQPSKAEMIKQVMDKYGAPTIVGDQHLYYIYRAGSIVSVGAKYKEATALDAIDRPVQGGDGTRRHRPAARAENCDQAQRRQWPRQLRGRRQTLAGQGKIVERNAGRSERCQLRRRAQCAANAGRCARPDRQCSIHAIGF
jgi:hypothetical protein